MSMEILNLQIDDELRAWIDPLSAEEYANLEASILQEGCRDPIVTWNGWIMDGHNRYEICVKHGIKFQTAEKAGLKSKGDVKIWMIQNQLSRRNLTDFSRAALALKLKPLLEKMASDKRVRTQIQNQSTVRRNSDEPGMRTDVDVAKAAGIGKDALRQVEKVLMQASPDVIAKAKAGEISINAAAKTIGAGKHSKQKQSPLESMPPQDADSVEVEQLEDPVQELQSSLKETLADNEMMGRVFDADDKLKAAMDEAKRQKAIADNAERKFNAQQGKVQALAEQVTYWKNRAERAERALKAAA